MLKKAVIILCLILWPLNFVINYDKISFSVKTIFENDYQGEQLVLRNIGLYPTPLLARVFQNKPRIYLTKYLQNFFILTDPNTYFFALHPQPLPGNVNLSKFPFMGVYFFLIGIFYFQKSRFKYLTISTLTLSVVFLSALKNFEGFDIVLWFPMSLIIINGINVFYDKNKKLCNYFSIAFLIFTIPEIFRSFFNR